MAPPTRIVPPEPAIPDTAILTTLTAREREVCVKICRGYTKKEIASLLILSTKTIEGHTETLYRKLGGCNRVVLVLWAIRAGLVSP